MVDEAGFAGRFPLDYDAIEMGFSLSPEDLSRITDCAVGTDAYRLKILALKTEVERNLWDRGRPWTVCIRDGCLCVLTDPEASEYNIRRSEHHVRGMFHSQRRLAAVNTGNLDDTRRATHERELRCRGMMIAAMANARREVEPAPYVRPFPLPPGER